ncbi:glutamate racemase [Chthonobacter rhizosphaerae]|uniref:glutamate racemase n=1 Tax=Chthonobacter rhizosphaerae TaxID=2735553 RepID=UPI0015EEC751|nr:glutamate racemase [Chthonobacter rhizosphaerae]
MRLLVFDSGVGGLSVVREILRSRPDADIAYVADTAVFPYGDLAPDVLVDRVVAVMDAVLPDLRADAAVIACNTASTLVLPPLRARFAVPFVGTVPAVKPAAASSRTRRVSVLATPGTVKRDYTRDLIREHGQDCRFALVGSSLLATLVERQLAGEDVPDAAYAAEIAPCFVDDGGARTDTVVLACTHFPLVLDRLRAVAPWAVDWIDPAPAIARRVTTVTEGAGAGDGRRAVMATGRPPSPVLLERLGFPAASMLAV